MTEIYDVAVIGLGIVGSAILAKLSEHHHVIGIDRFQPPHVYGSSHGENRIIRAAPGEGLAYAQMAARSFELLAELSRKMNFPLLHKTGGFDASMAPSDWAQRVKASCERHDLEFEEMSGTEFNRRYGNFNLPPDAPVILQPGYGHVDAERTWQTFLDIANDNGAVQQLGQKVDRVVYADIHEIILEDGTIIWARKIICAAGSWMNDILDIRLDLHAERRVLGWYEIEKHHGEILPFVFNGYKGQNWYGMPSIDGKCIKIGENLHLAEKVSPDHVAPVNADDLELLGRFIRESMRDVSYTPVKTAVCKYTLTGNKDFIMDRHPVHGNVFVFSCCSGHGFKYAPVYGEIAEAFVQGRDSGFDLGMFAIGPHVVG